MSLLCIGFAIHAESPQSFIKFQISWTFFQMITLFPIKYTQQASNGIDPWIGIPIHGKFANFK